MVSGVFAVSVDSIAGRRYSFDARGYVFDAMAVRERTRKVSAA